MHNVTFDFNKSPDIFEQQFHFNDRNGIYMLEKTEKGNQEGTIKRHWAHKTRDRDKQNKIQQRKLKR